MALTPGGEGQKPRPHADHWPEQRGGERGLSGLSDLLAVLTRRAARADDNQRGAAPIITRQCQAHYSQDWPKVRPRPGRPRHIYAVKRSLEHLVSEKQKSLKFYSVSILERPSL